LALSLEAAYRALDPQEVLAPDAPSYTARPVAPLATLATQLRLDRHPGVHLVSGHIGSGKTTELKRLEAELGFEVRARFVPLDAVSAEGRLSTVEIGTALLIAVVSVAQDKTLVEAAESRLVRNVFAGSFSQTVYSVMKATAAATGPPFSVGQSSASDGNHDGASARDAEKKLLEAIHSASEQARDQTGFETPPIVLLDGLDKLSVSELEVTLSRVLAWHLPISLVATVPLSYLFTPSFSRREGAFAGVHVVPALPVVGRDFQPNPPALAWFGSVLVSRGIRELFDQDAIEQLALMTAGIVRDFVRSCREAVLAALVQGRQHVDLEMAKIALDEFALRMSRPVSGDDLRVLNVVAQTGRVVGHSSFLALVDGGQIVEYRNGSNWYAVHPLLRDIVARFAEELAS
jgi:hypothetical protein